MHIGELFSLNHIIHQRSKFWQGIGGNFPPCVILGDNGTFLAIETFFTSVCAPY
jgi:hypothetical protein